MSPVSLLLVLRFGLVLWTGPVLRAHEIGLCIDLESATQYVRDTSPELHALTDLDRDACVFIDPCTQQTAAEFAVPRDTWVHVSTLGLPPPTTLLAAPNPGSTHPNRHSLEYARVPQGVLLEACQPDFAWYSQHAEWQCNEDARAAVQISGACPGLEAYTLLDCIRPLQFDAVALEPPSAGLFRAAPLGSTQLVRYSLQDSWGCYKQTDMADSQVTGEHTPNQVSECAPAAGKVFRKSVVACSFECADNYNLEDGVCTFKCDADMTTSCEHGFYATSVCLITPTHYECVACEYTPGQASQPWSAHSSTECAPANCPAGTSTSVTAGVCTPCGRDTFASAGAGECAPCAPGTFSEAGSAACVACFTDGAAPACGDGQQAFASVAAIEAYFALYPQDKYGLAARQQMLEFCHARGVCLPCQPGHYEQGGGCIPCAFAAYQPHFQQTLCFPCAHGQNTSRVGAESADECRCQGGFE